MIGPIASPAIVEAASIDHQGAIIPDEGATTPHFLVWDNYCAREGPLSNRSGELAPPPIRQYRIHDEAAARARSGMAADRPVLGAKPRGVADKGRSARRAFGCL